MTDTGFRKRKPPHLDVSVPPPVSPHIQAPRSASFAAPEHSPYGVDLLRSLKDLQSAGAFPLEFKKLATPVEKMSPAVSFGSGNSQEGASPPNVSRRHSLPLNILDRRNKVPPNVCTYSAKEASELVSNSTVLFLDVRPYAQFSEARICDAISVCIPSTLLKRTTFGFDRIVEFLPPDQASRLEKIDSYDHVIIYDSKTENLLNCGINPLFCTIQKFHAHISEAGLSETVKLGFMQGGIQSVLKESEDLIDTAHHEADENEVQSPRAPFNLLPVVTGVGMQGGLHSLTPQSSVFDDSSRVDMCKTVYSNIEMFPRWVQAMVKETRNGHNVLAENFRNIQLAEQARIQQALAHGSSRRSGGASGSGFPGDPFLAPPQLYHSSTGTSAISASSAITPTTRTPDSTSFLPFDPSATAYSFCTGDDVTKNRYSNICPYTHTRVVLKSDGERSDYINASHIQTKHSGLQYIATQCPLPNSFSDFWKVVWEQEVPVIMMLTALASESGQIKGHNYWKKGDYDGISVAVVKEEPIPELGSAILRKIKLEKRNARSGKVERRSVSQVYYDSWPDLGRPSSTKDMMELLNTKAKLMDSLVGDSRSSKPVIVHCSAGCGRTGTFCAIDSVLDYMKSTPLSELQPEDTDILNFTVQELRAQRLAMVHMQRQFQYCYDVIIEWYYKAYVDTSEQARYALPSYLRPIDNQDRAVHEAW